MLSPTKEYTLAYQLRRTADSKSLFCIDGFSHAEIANLRVLAHLRKSMRVSPDCYISTGCHGDARDWYELHDPAKCAGDAEGTLSGI
ncbi:hypothetical protein ACU8KH_05774 [Lachancea thermotolerans]